MDKFVWIVISMGLILRLVIAAIIPPGYDEAYYGVYSFFLNWGYFDHPPLVALVANVGHWITDIRSHLTLRLGTILLFTFTAILIYHTTFRLYGQRAARIVLILTHITPYFLIGLGAFVIPDNALGFFWVLMMYSMVRLQQSGKSVWWLLIGLSMGMALLSKYHAVLLFVSLGLVMVLYKEWRCFFKNRIFYVGLLISVLCVLPNIIWNAQHDWVSYVYQFGKGTSKLEFSLTWLLQAIGGQMAYLFPWTMIVLLIAVWLAWQRHQPKDRWLVIFALFPILGFTLIGATRQILPHWPMPGYIAALLLSGEWLRTWSLPRRRALLVSTASYTSIALVFLSVQSLTGLFPIDHKMDVSLDGQGWQAAAKHISKNELYSRDSSFLFTFKWYTAGQLAWALGPEFPVTVINTKHPHGFAFWQPPCQFIGKDGYFVGNNHNPQNPVQVFDHYFERITLIDSLQTFRNGKPANRFSIWQCTNFKGIDLEYQKSEEL